MADRRKPHLDRIERSLTGPKRIGLFGHRAVGKTTLLAMFYRQASSGRTPGIRLAAIDPRTADYLADKVNRIEAGEPPAGTLGETELRLRLYHDQARLELIVKDYQGEHVTLGSDEPIQQFFADCDAIFLCLDPEGSDLPAERLKRQQEIENLFERHIDRGTGGALCSERPVALLITKYDRILARQGVTAALGDEAGWRVERLVEGLYGMTKHALATHAPRSAMFAVSSYGRGGRDGIPPPPSELNPLGLDAPLTWLADELEAADGDLLDWLWDLAPDDLPRLSRCVSAFVQRYPKSIRAEGFSRRLAERAKGRGRRRLAWAAALVAAVLGGLAAYDAISYEHAIRFERDRERSAREVAGRWRRLIAWHPTLPLFLPSRARLAERKLSEWSLAEAGVEVELGKGSDDLRDRLLALKEQRPDLKDRIARVEEAVDRADHDRIWHELKTESLLVEQTNDPEKPLKLVDTFLRKFPESAHKSEALALGGALRRRASDRRELVDRQALDSLDRSEKLPSADLQDLIAQANDFLSQHPETSLRGEFEARIGAFSRRLDDRDFDRSAEYARRYPGHYATRIQKYQEYLKAHASGGRHVRDAMEARDAVAREWDVASYRQAYDQLQAHPNDVAEVARRLRDYLRDHPDGQYKAEADLYLAWWDKVSTPHDYRVTLRRGEVESDVGKYLSGGAPDLQVTLEVAGVKHGPSPVISNSHSPIWDYTFPRPVSWKLGDPVVIKIVDTDWSDSTIYTLKSAKGDPLAIRMLSGTVTPASGGKTMLVFASDFSIPRLAKPEANRR